MNVFPILKKGNIGVIPTDTLYGIVGSAFSKKAVERIYEVKGRDENKPFIVLIASISDLKKFDIALTVPQKKLLDGVWPASVSVILPCPQKKFQYLHRGTKSLAFRLPKDRELQTFLKQTGPLVAPSANPQGGKPAETIAEAKKYFVEKLTNMNNSNIGPQNVVRWKPSLPLQIVLFCAALLGVLSGITIILASYSFWDYFLPSNEERHTKKERLWASGIFSFLMCGTILLMDFVFSLKHHAVPHSYLKLLFASIACLVITNILYFSHQHSPKRFSKQDLQGSPPEKEKSESVVVKEEPVDSKDEGFLFV